MERSKNNKLNLGIILTIFYVVGLFLHLINFFDFLLKYLTPIFLFSVFILIVLEDQLDKKFILWLVIAYIFTFSMEVIGVKTSLIFGNYYYGENLGIKIFDVPFVIGLNWITLMLGSIGLTSGTNINFLFRVFLVGIIMCVIDLILEFIAPALNYWFWREGMVPIKNFVSWFLIAVIMSLLYFSLNINRKLFLAKLNSVLQFFFFLILLLSET